MKNFYSSPKFLSQFSSQFYIGFWLLFSVMTMTITSSVQAAPAVGSAFSYQGELLDNGSPANGSYNFVLKLYVSGNNTVIASQNFNAITVSNGLFNIPNVDFGDVVYADGVELFIEVSVEPSSGGSLVALSPRQRLSAVPFAVQAEYLAANGASNGEVLQFDGNDWVAQAVNFSKWTVNGSAINYNLGRVGIGDNISNPLARLHVRAAATGEDPLRVQVNASTKFMVHENGGVSIGTSGSAPTNGLVVTGETNLNNNISQASGFGVIKYAVYAYCSNGLSGTGGFASASLIYRFKSNVNGQAVTIENGASGNSFVGECEITFPSNVTSAFWVVSITGNDPELGAHCSATASSANKLHCYGIRERDGDKRPVSFNLLVF